MPLTPTDRSILDFESSWWTRLAVKTDGVRRELGISPSVYYRRLASLLDDPDAQIYDPLLLRRLKRRRSARLRGQYEGAAEPQRPRR